MGLSLFAGEAEGRLEMVLRDAIRDSRIATPARTGYRDEHARPRDRLGGSVHGPSNLPTGTQHLRSPSNPQYVRNKGCSNFSDVSLQLFSDFFVLSVELIARLLQFQHQHPGGLTPGEQRQADKERRKQNAISMQAESKTGEEKEQSRERNQRELKKESNAPAGVD